MENVINQEVPTVWAEESLPGMAKAVPPVIVQITYGTIPI